MHYLLLVGNTLPLISRVALATSTWHPWGQQALNAHILDTGSYLIGYFSKE